ncbi:phosphoribosylaminoimidazolesuccinocarboxamide synthase [Saccharomonospora iraqiensis]|uniref:phosphoribosylaminoimidazolesuccinocarboxamide synthase n=1 Tax=Saccharomonospora iraqiensis TaxID=52698 RepID=UPI0002E1427E|nr:phosphoribosylaminoimidazolesuccinocarboxamide synthase [Saccharomonospora iraqiensis]
MNSTNPEYDEYPGSGHVRPPDPNTPPTVEGRSKKLWMVDERTCLVRLVESLSSFTFNRHDILPGTGRLRLDFHELASRRLTESGVACSFIRRLDATAYLSRFRDTPPFEVIVKNRAVGSTTRKYPGLFGENESLPAPVVKFDYRCDPEDQPIADDYLRVLGLPVDEMRRIALKVNTTLTEWLAPHQLWDFCLIFGIDESGNPEIISEISPDCMRLRSTEGRPLDKDLFRHGYSDAEIIETWEGLVAGLRD